MATWNVEVPDMGDVEDVEVVEVLVRPGEAVKRDQSLIVLESDKASVEIPAPEESIVHLIHVKVGDRVTAGTLMLELVAHASEGDDASVSVESAQPIETATAEPETPLVSAKADSDESDAVSLSEFAVDSGADDLAAASLGVTDSISEERVTFVLRVPDLGDIEKAEVTDMLCQVGDVVAKDQVVLVLESEKASLEVTAEVEGEISAVLVRVGAAVVSQDALLELSVVQENSGNRSHGVDSARPANILDQASGTDRANVNQVSEQAPIADLKGPVTERLTTALGGGGRVHAGPAVRKLAREFGIELSQVQGSGPHGRVLKDDLQHFVRMRLSEGTPNPSGDQRWPIAQPLPDFSRFGATSIEPLTKIRKVSAKNLHQSWVTIPHVTHFDEADITEMERFRQELNQRGEGAPKITPLAFFIKAVTLTLKLYPRFNASIDPELEHWILKDFFNIGIAVETESGLVVPNVKGADSLGIIQLAQVASGLAEKARTKKLLPQDLQGATFTISSLGGIGGTGFTPIINSPEVAILGVARAEWLPRYIGADLERRLIVPLSLSYDHRAIDGAEAARFLATVAKHLSDLRYLSL